MRRRFATTCWSWSQSTAVTLVQTLVSSRQLLRFIPCSIRPLTISFTMSRTRHIRTRCSPVASRHTWILRFTTRCLLTPIPPRPRMTSSKSATLPRLSAWRLVWQRLATSWAARRTSSQLSATDPCPAARLLRV